MNFKLIILTSILLISCINSNKLKENDKNNNLQKLNSDQLDNCDYIKEYEELGNRRIDTFRLEKKLVDPIDDFVNFRNTGFGFVKRGDKIYKKARTHRSCDSKFIEIEFYQDLTNRIELETYKEYDEIYFTTKNGVYFWWVNSCGHLVFPINKADPKTFKPFKDICGGTDKNGIYYGCPNYGVYQLNIPVNSSYEFVPKKKNYWNSPNHFVIIDNKVYDVKYDLERGYFCELNKDVLISEISKINKIK